MDNDNQQKSASTKLKQEIDNLKEELRELQKSELVHLELEFENYKLLDPTINGASGVH
jgi:hypothetical protein